MPAQPPPATNYPRPPIEAPPAKPVNSPIVTWGLLFMVVVLLLGIFAPIPQGGGIHAAKAAVCMSNLKQMGVAAVMYAGDFDDRLPSSRTWVDQTLPYAKVEAIYQCPELVKGQYGYAMNSERSGRAIRSGKSAEKTILFFESTDLLRNAHGHPDNVVARISRHGNRRGICFEDAHAKRQIVREEPSP